MSISNFCPLCGNLLFVYGNVLQGNSVKCKTCIYQKSIEKKRLWYNVKTSLKKKDDIFVDNTNPETENAGKCPKCDHSKAFFKEIQMRSSDEGTTLFLKCANTLCGHQWNVTN